MIELETSSGSDNVKHNKHHKYTLDEALQAVLKFNDEKDYSDLSDQRPVSSMLIFQLLLIFTHVRIFRLIRI